METKDLEQPDKNKWLASRAPGCFILIIGFIAAYVGIIQPLREMLNGVGFISYSSEVVGAAILAIVFGLAMTVFGQEELNQMFSNPDKKGIATSGIVFVVFVIGIVLIGMWLWEKLVIFLGYGSIY